MKTTSYRVRPVTRYVITRYTSDPENGAGSCETLGEFDNESYADDVLRALVEVDVAHAARCASGNPDKDRWDAHIRMERESRVSTQSASNG